MSGERVGGESGIALPLAIMTIVLIGVMGAGLLTFVIADLTAVVEVNQGQKAFDMADAGVNAAKRQMASVPDSGKYDGVGSVAAGTESQWSLGAGGMNLSFPGLSGASVNVKINYASNKLVVLSEGKAGAAKRKIEAVFAPRTGGGSQTGTIPQMVYAYDTLTGDRVALEGMMMYSKGSMRFSQDDVVLDNATVFSGGDILLNLQNSRNFTVRSSGSNLQIDQNNCGGSQDYVKVTGTDPFGNWASNPTYNDKARTTAATGMGAVGDIGDVNNTDRKPCGWGTQFFDRNTGRYLDVTPAANRAQFVHTPSSPQGADQITYPFDENLMSTADATTGLTRHQQLAEDLKTKAKSQTTSPTKYSFPSGGSTSAIGPGSVGNYVELESSGGVSEVNICDAAVACGTSPLTINFPSVPATIPASQWPVVYVKFLDRSTNNNVKWRVQTNPQFGGGNDPSVRCSNARTSSPSSIRRGIVVVENGSFEVNENAAPLDGGIVTIGEDNAHSRTVGGSAGDFCVRGPVIADGPISRQNYTGYSALGSSDYTQLPGFGGGGVATPPVQETWRELYQ